MTDDNREQAANERQGDDEKPLAVFVARVRASPNGCCHLADTHLPTDEEMRNLGWVRLSEVDGLMGRYEATFAHWGVCRGEAAQ